MNRDRSTTPYLNRNVKGEEPELSFYDGDGVEGDDPARDVLDEVEDVVEDLHAIEAERGVDVRGGAGADAAVGGRYGAEGAAAVGDGDDEGAVVEGVEGAVADADGEVDDDVEGDGVGGDAEAVEAEAGDGEVGVGWPEEVGGGGEEKEGGGGEE